ncbi:GAF domain-containing protein [Plantactinospora sp. B5E13]|uniref:GAF domain-containing protein n=1 Tax=unclassified Plantactinospora TaxID=2631981 RepID=UPI00325C6106
MTRTPSLPDIVRQAAAITASPIGEDRPAQWLSLLRQVVPYDAAWLSLADDRNHRFVEVTSTGYPERIQTYFGTRASMDQAEQAGLTESPVPQCGRDHPIPAVEYEIWSDYYLPAGFREGLAVGLLSQDRRHIGMLALSTEDAGHPTDAERDLIGVLAPRIAATLDPLRSLAVLARVVHDAVAGLVLTRAGEPFSLCGLPGHPLLAAGSPLLAVIDEMAPRGEGSVSFLWPVRQRSELVRDVPEAIDGLFRVVLLGCAAAPAPVLGLAMLAPLPKGWSVLNRRELVVLGLLLAGWTDEQVAVGLDLPLTTVIDTVCRSIVALQAPDRHVALLRAARRGWFIPHRAGTAPRG